MQVQGEFHVPARDDTLRVAYTSCNGFETDKDKAKVGEFSTMWRDMERQHRVNPIHVLIGGGDQLYNDKIFSKVKSTKAWHRKSQRMRWSAEFTPRMRQAAERFYFNHYMMHFSRPGFRDMMSSIPTVFSWDDHDIYDGAGSYKPEENNCAVRREIYAIARKYYLLFQQQLAPDEDKTALGFIGSKSDLHSVLRAGRTMIVQVDGRSERVNHYTTAKAIQGQIVPSNSWDNLFAIMERQASHTDHVILMLGVPLLYPEQDEYEKFFTKLDYRPGVRGIVARKMFHSVAGLSDDLIDHWDSKFNRDEAEQLIERIQNFAAKYRVRVTIVSGDVHCAGVANMKSRKPIEDIYDPYLVYQIISSPVANIPMPKPIAWRTGKHKIELPRSSMLRERTYTSRILKMKSVGQRLYGGRRNYAILEYKPVDKSLMTTLRFENGKTHQLVVPRLERD